MSGNQIYNAGFNRGKLNSVQAARQARVVLNGKPDKKLISDQRTAIENIYQDSGLVRVFPEAPYDNQYHDIQVGDALFVFNAGQVHNVADIEARALRNKRRKTKKSSKNKAQVRCIANPCSTIVDLKSFNLTSKPDFEDLRVAARSLYKFVGFSDTNYEIDTTNVKLQKTGLAIQRGGVLTYHNTGTQTIKAFDKVMWDIPDWHNRSVFEGVEQKALKFELKPVDPFQVATYENLARIPPSGKKKYYNGTIVPVTMSELARSLDVFFPDWRGDEQFKRIFYGLSYLLHDQNSRIVGVALDSAVPGNEGTLLAGAHF